MNKQEEPNPFQQMFEIITNSDIQNCIDTVEQIIGFQLSDYARQPFLRYHKYISSDPPPSYITRWRSNGNLEHWYHKHVNGILGNTQNALACVYYHRDRLVDFEDQVLKKLQIYKYKEVLGNSVLGLSNTQKWDFEYQAFILAARRCLDYLVRALAAYFQTDFHSFNRLPISLRSKHPETLVETLIKIHAKHKPRLAFVLSDGNRKSTRDWISHYGYVPVGTINLSANGFMLVGGGENLEPIPAKGSVLLSAKIDQHLLDIQYCIEDIIDCFIEEVKSIEKGEQN